MKAPIAEGVDKHKVLDKGMVGHYSGVRLDTAMPWDKKGNFAVAGHRNTHGEPFRYVNKLVTGDKVVVETESTYYTYEITAAALRPRRPTRRDQARSDGSGFKDRAVHHPDHVHTGVHQQVPADRLGQDGRGRPRSKGKPTRWSASTYDRDRGSVVHDDRARQTHRQGARGAAAPAHVDGSPPRSASSANSSSPPV